MSSNGHAPVLHQLQLGADLLAAAAAKLPAAINKDIVALAQLRCHHWAEWLRGNDSKMQQALLHCTLTGGEGAAAFLHTIVVQRYSTAQTQSCQHTLLCTFRVCGDVTACPSLGKPAELGTR